MAEENVTSLNKFYRTVDLILRHMFVAVTESIKVWRNHRNRLFLTSLKVSLLEQRFLSGTLKKQPEIVYTPRGEKLFMFPLWVDKEALVLTWYSWSARV